jgi:hypothetical protein
MTTRPLPSNPCLSSICGTCVDLPEPVGACNTSRRLAATFEMIWLSIW